MKVANLWKSNSWLVWWWTRQPAKLLRQKLEMDPFKILLFIHSLHMIFIYKFEEESLWFSESAPSVCTSPQLLVQICHTTECRRKKCIIFKFNTNLLPLDKHFFIAYYKSIATSYHDITITVTLTIFNSYQFPHRPPATRSISFSFSGPL